MDASEYKHVVLGLIFLKYISDKFETKFNELMAEGKGFEEDRDEYAGIIDPDNFSSFPKNPTIARFFKEIGLVDELGSGIRNTYKYSKIYSGAEPIFTEGDVYRTIIPLTMQADEEISRMLEYCKTLRTRSETQKYLKFNNREYYNE